MLYINMCKKSFILSESHIFTFCNLFEVNYHHVHIWHIYMQIWEIMSIAISEFQNWTHQMTIFSRNKNKVKTQVTLFLEKHNYIFVILITETFPIYTVINNQLLQNKTWTMLDKLMILFIIIFPNSNNKTLLWLTLKTIYPPLFIRHLSTLTTFAKSDRIQDKARTLIFSLSLSLKEWIVSRMYNMLPVAK